MRMYPKIERIINVSADAFYNSINLILLAICDK